MTRAEYTKQRRALARLNGYCPDCCKRPLLSGFRRCEICLENNRATHARRAGRTKGAAPMRVRRGISPSTTPQHGNARLAQLSSELHRLAGVLSASTPEFDRRMRKRQRIHCGLLIEHGLIDQYGRPSGWTVEEDIREELLALSELSAFRRVG